jgi:hypothetical protein
MFATALLVSACDDDAPQLADDQTEGGAAAPTSPASPTPVGSVMPAPSPSPGESLPQLVRFAPGQVVDVQTGVFYVDPRTGAVDAWQVPGDLSPVGFEVSPNGRYIAYGGSLSQQPGSLPSWRVFDTRRNVVRDLSYGPPQFAPDEERYAVAGPDGVSIVRAQDGVVERAFPIARFREPLGFVPRIDWSPDSATLLVAFDEPPWAGRAEGRVIRLTPATGEATEVANGVLPYPRWSPDGRLFFVIDRQGDGLRAMTPDGRPAWTVSLSTLGMVMPAPPDKPPAVQASLPWTSPDGQHTAVSFRGDLDAPFNRVYVFDTATGAVRFWVDGSYTCPLHAWTADSRWLLVNGARGDERGAFLVSADGSTLRFLAPHVADLSPTDSGIAGLRGGDGGLATIDVLDVPTGDVQQRIRFTGDLGWDTNHDPIWLTDGRMVAHAPHPGHGGCGEGPLITEQLAVRFPP